MPPNFPPLRDGAVFTGWPRPPPLFLPPVSLFTVAQARRSASPSGTPRVLVTFPICSVCLFCFWCKLIYRHGALSYSHGSCETEQCMSSRQETPSADPNGSRSISLLRSLGPTRTCLSAIEPHRSRVDYAEETFDGSSIVDQQTRRDLFRVSGAAGLGLVASRAMLNGVASAQPAAVVQAQPNPSSIAGDQTTADIIVETLITWEVSVIFGMVGDGIGPTYRGHQRTPR